MGKYRPKPRGICNQCGHERILLSLLRGYCKPCGYEYGNCARCCAYRKLYVSDLCYGCYQDDCVKNHLEEVIRDFVSSVSEYNNHLFQLFITYTQRYRLTYSHLKTAKNLLHILKQNPIPTIQSWQHIYQLAKKYPLKSRLRGRNNRDNGCAWIQIGWMLQELGILEIRSDEYEHRIPNLIKDMDFGTSNQVLQFLSNLKKKGCTDSTLYRYLTIFRSLHCWLLERASSETLWTANSLSIECYFDFLFRNKSKQNTLATFRIIACFYSWAKQKKLILIDPTENIQFSRAAEKILICSKTEFTQLCAFIKSRDSDPDQALALLLILFYGFTPRDLAQASLEPSNNRLKIILERKPRSRGRRYHNREQVLELPSQPDWLPQLKLRFQKKWQMRYSKILLKSSFPRTPLFLHPHCESNRNLSSDSLQILIAKATTVATGNPIPPRVLKQTCGHIHVRGNDASILSQLGWSPSFAFHYTWLPRVQYRSSKAPVGTTPTGTGGLEGM